MKFVKGKVFLCGRKVKPTHSVQVRKRPRSSSFCAGKLVFMNPSFDIDKNKSAKLSMLHTWYFPVLQGEYSLKSRFNLNC